MRQNPKYLKNSDYQPCEFFPKWTCSKKVKIWDCEKCKGVILKINEQMVQAKLVREIGA